MKRIWQRFVGSVLGAILLVGTAVCGTACTPSGRPSPEEGYFQYKIMNNETAAIVGLTETGKEQEILVLPETIGGYPVASIGILYSFIGGVFKEWESEKLEKLFVPFRVERHITFEKCPSLKKVIMLTSMNGTTSSEVSFFSRSDRIGFADNIANISYMYNYEESPNNGYYWIDDLDYGSKIDWQPQNPEREGYVFQGWYKESECLNEWDFEEDTLPERLTETDEDGTEKTVYQETRLYAKWA